MEDTECSDAGYIGVAGLWGRGENASGERNLGKEIRGFMLPDAATGSLALHVTCIGLL